ncbi:hypothetical protein PVK06_043604 [Gossypium arboreum]|uniref:Uncharacterized protein n=1 Tax=Gossypium arboreum TaxID=29729 RepID=A0ABR0MPE0_GOSAR|nr:hypothetical protein PVK06_043604 [Gossypium arboreum]
MVVDLSLKPSVSWKDRLLRKGSTGPNESYACLDNGSEEEFPFMEGDFKISTVNGIPMIDFSEWIQQLILIEGYGIHSGCETPWEKHRSMPDYEKVLTQGSWIVFGQYLTV